MPTDPTQSYTIDPKELRLETIKVDGVEDRYYNGSPITFDLKVTDKALSDILTEGTDYTIKYENNVEVGTATVKISGTATKTRLAMLTNDTPSNNYTDTITLNYQVLPGKIEVKSSGYEGNVDGKEHSINVQVVSPAGAKVEYGTSEGNYNLAEAPQYDKAGEYTTYYKVTAHGYEDYTGSEKVVLKSVGNNDSDDDDNGGKSGGKGTQTDTARTGDMYNLAGIAMLIVVSGGTAVVILVSRRRNKARQRNKQQDR